MLNKNYRFKDWNLKSYFLIACLVGFLVSFDANAQGCSGGTTINSSQTSTYIVSTSNDCLTVSNIGSITVTNLYENAVDVNPGVTGVGINNSGSIAGYSYGVHNEGSLVSLINSSITVAATIAGTGDCGINGCAGVANFGTIGTLNNSANSSISAGAGVGIVNFGSSSSIGTLDNSGTILGVTFSGIQNEGVINSLVNRGDAAISGDAGIFNYRSPSRINAISNSGTITGVGSQGIENEGAIGSLTNNSGAVITGASTGINNTSNASVITSLINFGTIVGLTNQGIDNHGTIDSIENRGGATISGFGVGISNSGTSSVIGNLTNSGSILGGASFSGIDNGGRIANLTNNSSGSIVGGGVGILNRPAASISNITNAGTIGGSFYGIGNSGTIDSINNSGAITSSSATGIGNSGLINLLANSGSITGDIAVTCAGGALDCDAVRKGSGRINALNNSGSIGGDVYVFMNAPTPGALPSIGTLNNSGSINRIYLEYLTGEGVAIESVNNTGHILNGIDIRFLISDASAGIGTLVNNGAIDGGIQISTVGSTGGLSSSGIKSFINTGMVTGGIAISNIQNYGVTLSGIETLTNLGVISGGITVSSIWDGSVGIATLNNIQGSSSGSVLSYSGKLPTNYNIIVNSPSKYGQLAVTSPSGSTNFGIYTGSTLNKGTYSSVLSGVTSSNLSGATSGNYNGFTWGLNNSSGDIWDLVVLGASTADTQQSLVNTASALQGTYALQNSVIVNGFTYDCPLFDKNGICISAGGRNTSVQAQGINNTSGLLIASYRLDKNNSRIGAWVDQNLSVNGSGAVKLDNGTPVIGLFGVWSERPDGVGAEFKLSAAYGQKNATVTRQVVGSSEAGTGSSNLNSQGAQVTAKYGFGLLDSMVASPYVGVRYTQNNMGGYSEAATSAVTAPLTYSALNTNATTALAGIGVQHKFDPKMVGFASAGVESDINTNNGTYSATGIVGLTPVNFNPNPVKTRPTATVGAYYDIEKNQRLGITGIYRQEPYQSVSTTTVLATYTVGL